MEYYNIVTRSVFNFKYFEGPTIVYVSTTINHFMAAFDFDFSFLSILN